jgi:hypothetical protein
MSVSAFSVSNCFPFLKYRNVAILVQLKNTGWNAENLVLRMYFRLNKKKSFLFYYIPSHLLSKKQA